MHVLDIITIIDGVWTGLHRICTCGGISDTSSAELTPTIPKPKVVAVKPLTLNRTSMARVSFESLPWSEPKSPRGQPRPTTTKVSVTAEDPGAPRSSCSTSNHRGTGKSVVSQSPETLDYTGEVSPEGSPDRSHPLLDSYATRTKEGRSVTLHVLRASKDKTWVDNVKLALESAIRDWRRVEGPLIRYVGFATIDGAFAVLTERPSSSQSAKEYFATSPDEKEKRQLIIELACALELLHKAGLCHGRLEPRHVLVDKNKNVILSGFGLLQLVEEEFVKFNSESLSPGRYTDPRSHKESSKPWFFAIFKIFKRFKKTQAPTGVHSDVYCFALVALELLTGEVPFASIPEDADVSREILVGRTPAAGDYGNFIDDPWWKVLWPCISKEVGSRPSISDVHKRLSSLRT